MKVSGQTHVFLMVQYFKHSGTRLKTRCHCTIVRYGTSNVDLKSIFACANEQMETEMYYAHVRYVRTISVRHQSSYSVNKFKT